MADIDDRKTALIAQLAAQRSRLSRSAGGVRESLRVGPRIKSSFAKNPAAWLGGAVFAGLVLTRFRSGKTTRTRSATDPLKGAAVAGLAWPVMQLIFTIARPTLISLLTARLSDFASGRKAPRQGGRR